MAPARLTLVPPHKAPAAESPAERIRRLQQEAQTLARVEIEALHEAMVNLSRQAEEIAEGGEAYAVGARELARRLSEDVGAKAQTLQAILHKN